ncbi:Deoxyuridine 5'-triphosphate nucleotidohydrolase [Phycisphaerae bacterium RAS1]|nr:Deoxyuridine 5'-triphosphate nucleotidohydrolase [Phycisphaerae bacterium RAS1]
MRPTLKIRRDEGCDDIPLPRYQSEHAAGLDLHAAVNEPLVIHPGDVRLVPTGLFVEIPIGFEGQIRARSGMALKHGLIVPNAPGTIDADYRGQVQVIVGNCAREPFTITRGMRIAQLVIAPVQMVDIQETTHLSETARGAGGFGHTGRG